MSKIDENYIYLLKFLKCSLFIILTYGILYFSIDLKDNNIQYKTILTITVALTIIFYLLDLYFPICNVVISND